MGDTYDPGTDVGYVRFLVSDTREDDDQIFSEAEIQQAITREGSLKLAAAQLMEIVADNEALILKAIRTQDLNTDGPKTAETLRNRARSLRAQGEDELEAGGSAEDVAVIGWPCYTHAELEARRVFW